MSPPSLLRTQGPQNRKAEVADIRAIVPPLDLRIVEPAPKTVLARRLPWILCALLALISVGLGVRVWLPSRVEPNSPPGGLAVPPRLLAAVIDPGRPTIVVAPDSGIPIYSDLFGRTVGLTDYLTAGFPESLLPPQTDPSTQEDVRTAWTAAQWSLSPPRWP